ncbi:MAG: PaaI family thioesterase [Thermoleophilaceae bacterium]
MTLSHHELCFGCGTANLFGLQLELEPEGDGVAGRFFVKQDHQGPPGFAHGGVLSAALDEAMSIAVWSLGTRALTRQLEIELLAPVPVGVFVQVEARVESWEAGKVWAVASASAEPDPRLVARGRALFVEPG